MIARLLYLSSRRAATSALALSVLLPTAVCVGQAVTSVYSNPRAGADDPRVGLKGGLYDAGEASSGMKLVATLPKPGRFAPDLAAVAAIEAAPPEPVPAPEAGPRVRGPRTPRAPNPYGPYNSDLAFGGNYVFVGNYNGINFYDISNPEKIRLVTSLVCPGGQGDVSVYGHLLFMSDEAANGRIDCGTQGIPLPPGYVPPERPVRPAPGTETPSDTGDATEIPRARFQRPPEPASPERFRGVRIFDISDISNPKQVAAVQTCRGSHTHTLLIDPKDRDNIYVYVSGSAGVRSPKELPGCSSGDAASDPNTALFTIVVIKVPLAHPELAKVVASPRIFTDPKTGAIDGLFVSGAHGLNPERRSAIRGCHDITVYSSIGLAAGACIGNGILLNIADPVHPVRIEAKADSNFSFWHSATFSNDGTKVLFTDEWGGGSQPRCRASDPMDWGADAIFKLSNGKLEQQSYYKMPAPQSDLENCVAHNGSLIPIPGRDIEVQAWYQGGVSIVDFTDSTHPYEVGYFNRGPVSDKRYEIGGEWSAYWYNGYIYGSEIARGIDVFKLVPNKFLTQNEINAAAQIHVAELNVQNQQKFVWPASFVTARAYIDQLVRSNTLTPARITTLNAAITKFQAQPANRKNVSRLNGFTLFLEKTASKTESQADVYRLQQLAAILRQEIGVSK